MPKNRDRSLVTLRRQRPWILGACAVAALSLAPLRADAGQLDAGPPTLPDESTPTPAPDVQPDPTPAPSTSGGQPPPPTAPTRADDRLSLEGSALWAGVVDKRVVLDLKNGNELRGSVVAQDADNLAFARLSDGMIVSVPKSEIAGLRVRPDEQVSSAGGASTSTVPYDQRPRNSGRGAVAGGIAMLALGVPLGISGTVMLGICAYCYYIHLPLLLPGIGLIAGGSVALKRGKDQEKRFRKAWGIPVVARMQVTPTLSVGRSGGELGFTLRF